MTQSERDALRVAKQCIKREIKQIAANANLSDMYGADFPAATSASNRKARLERSLEEIDRMMK